MQSCHYVVIIYLSKILIIWNLNIYQCNSCSLHILQAFHCSSKPINLDATAFMRVGGTLSKKMRVRGGLLGESSDQQNWCLWCSVQRPSTKAASGWIGYAYGGADQNVFLHIREVKDGSTLMWWCHYPNFLLSTQVISLKWSPWTCLYLIVIFPVLLCTFHLRICLVQAASTFDKLRCQVVLCGPWHMLTPHLRCEAFSSIIR
jgi:hypothetical protein